jgi:hypothetical protein
MTMARLTAKPRTTERSSNIGKLDDAPEIEDGKPVRMCAVTRERRPDETLLRFVIDPAGRVTPDIRRKLPGRGVWVTASRTMVAEAVKRKAFARGLKAEAVAHPDLPEQVGELLRSAALQSLSLATKAGQAISGFMKVNDLVASGGVQTLLHAAEAGADGRLKLNRKYEAVAAAKGLGFFVIDEFKSEELNVAFGRQNVIHAALKYSGITDKFVWDVRRLQAYDGLEPPAAREAQFHSEKANQVDG